MIYGISLNKNNRGTLCAELIKILREKILKGDIKNGEKLPSSRVLSSELGVARNTVVEAFEQLIAEGYLETRSGSGTYVKVISNLSLYRSEETSTENERVKAEFPKGDNRIRYRNARQHSFSYRRLGRDVKAGVPSGPREGFRLCRQIGNTRAQGSALQISVPFTRRCCRSEKFVCCFGYFRRIIAYRGRFFFGRQKNCR